MSRSKFVFKQKIVKISEVQQKSIEEMMDSGRFASEADIFRQALEMFYRKFIPPYLKPTVNQEMKRSKINKELAVAAIPDEDFVAKSLEDVMIYTDNENVKWVLYREIGNGVGAVKLTEIKEWVKDENNYLYTIHKQTAGTVPLTYKESLTHNSTRQWLNQRFGVAIKFDPNFNGGIYDEELGTVRP